MALTADRAREVLDYNPDTGEFRWKVRKATWTPPGMLAGYMGNHGYRAPLRKDSRTGLLRACSGTLKHRGGEPD
jgi:hypothetical protein